MPYYSLYIQLFDHSNLRTSYLFYFNGFSISNLYSKISRKKMKIDLLALKAKVSLSSEKIVNSKIEEIKKEDIAPDADIATIGAHLVFHHGIKIFFPKQVKEQVLVEENIYKDKFGLFLSLKNYNIDTARSILAPPTSFFPLCESGLVLHHRETSVRVYTLIGQVTGQKWSLWCCHCNAICGYLSMVGK